MSQKRKKDDEDAGSGPEEDKGESAEPLMTREKLDLVRAIVDGKPPQDFQYTLNSSGRRLCVVCEAVAAEGTVCSECALRVQRFAVTLRDGVERAEESAKKKARDKALLDALKVVDSGGMPNSLLKKGGGSPAKGLPATKEELEKMLAKAREEAVRSQSQKE